MQVALSMLDTERNHRVTQIVQEIPVTRLSAESSEATYVEFMTPYAFG